MIVAIPITIRFFLPLYSHLNIDTTYEYLQIRFNSIGLRILGAVMFIVYQTGRMSIIMYLPLIVLTSLQLVSAIHRKVKCITEEVSEGLTVYTACIKKTEEGDKA